MPSNAPADPDARHRAGVLLLLRTPGLHTDVRGVEDDWWFARGEAARRFEHTFGRNWWCGPQSFPRFDQPGRWGSDLLALLYGTAEVPFPSFITASERAAVGRERSALSALGAAPTHLAGEAVAWARASPQDPNAAEALAPCGRGHALGLQRHADEHAVAPRLPDLAPAVSEDRVGAPDEVLVLT